MLSSLLGHSQNLVPNWSFEDTLACPNGVDEVASCMNWFNPCLTSPDYFNSCNGNVSSSNVPTNVAGNQNARTGEAYAGIIPYLYNNNNNYNYEYVSIALTDSLVAGEQYCVEFYVSLAEEARYAISSIGAHLSNDSLVGATNAPFTVIPQIENPSGNILNDIVSWNLVSGQHTAVGGEKFLTIGNFKLHQDVQIVDTIDNTGGIDGAYYYIDDVRVVRCDSLVGISEQSLNSDLISIYPNPTSGVFALHVEELKNSEPTGIEVFDVLGKKVFSQRSRSYRTDIDIKDQENGLYFVKVHFGDGTLVKRIVKQ